MPVDDGGGWLVAYGDCQCGLLELSGSSTLLHWAFNGETGTEVSKHLFIVIVLLYYYRNLYYHMFNSKENTRLRTVSWC